MTDIVERLRRGYMESGRGILDEAADEIEKLQAENRELNEALQHTVKAIISHIPADVGREMLAALTAAVQRMKALEDIHKRGEP